MQEEFALGKHKVNLPSYADMDSSQHSDYRDYKWALELNRFSLAFLGVWPKNNETRRQKLVWNVCMVIILNVIIWSSLVPTLHSLLRIWGDLLSMIDNLQCTIPYLMAIMKLSITWHRKEDILPLLNTIKEDWLRLKTSEERRVMVKRARIARKITVFGYFTTLLSLMLFFILPTFGISIRYLTNRTDPGKLMPLQTHYVYDNDRSPFYEITYVLQSFSAITAVIMYTGTDSFLGVLVFHMCGQLEILRARIGKLDRFNDFDDAISRNVQDHRRLIRSISTIDNVFNLMLLGALIHFGVLFVFYGFFFITVLTRNHDLSVLRLMFIVTVFINTFAHTCLYCVVGEILVAQCEGIYKAVCEYKWYMLETKKARKLLMIMVCANKPLHLTAGKLLPMTIATFCNMLKTSGGYISVLVAHREYKNDS